MEIMDLTNVAVAIWSSVVVAFSAAQLATGAWSKSLQPVRSTHRTTSASPSAGMLHSHAAAHAA